MALPDAVHLSVAALNGVDYLLSWNCKHIVNAEIVPRIINAFMAWGYQCPYICTPHMLMESSAWYGKKRKITGKIL